MFNLPQIEQKILKFWQEKKIFEKSLNKDSPHGDFVFYDGPPFATGTPHYGHLVASLMKDIVPRYWTMKGYHVERRWGWDCHGLPIENIVEEEMGIKSKKDIEEKIGVEKFNETCRSKVLLYAKEWRQVIERLGRWVDMDNDYKTMDKDYMESVWWVFKQLWNKGLIYEGYKSMHICPRCETTLSQFEVAEGYREVEDLSGTFKFKLKLHNHPLPDGHRGAPLLQKEGTDGEVYILAWTTTPWTLIGNVVLAVGEKIEYVVVKIQTGFSQVSKEETTLKGVRNNANEDGEYYILAKDLLKKVFGGRSFTIVQDDIRGKDLVGLKYEPLFDLGSDINKKILNLRGDGKQTIHAFIFDNKNRLLSGLRKYDEGEYWIVPGGRSDVGETLGETLKRELKEECNITQYKIKKYLGTKEGVNEGDKVNWFLIEVDNLEQIKNNEPEKFKEWKFIEIDKLPKNISHKDDIEYYKQGLAWNKAYKIYLADFVTTEEGTGVVHIAPAFGEDDLNLGREKNLPFIQHVGLDGRIKEEITDFAGLEVKPKDAPTETDKKIVEELKKKGLVFATEKYIHNYPHCWRCDSPLLNYATSSWFVKVEKIKPKALKTAKNINWVPAHIKAGRFGQWLEGARDWSISRQRFWGSVLPIWVCDKCGKIEAFGSIKELEDRSGQEVEDLHKHFVDKITFQCEEQRAPFGKLRAGSSSLPSQARARPQDDNQDCDGTMRRIPDVLDCWFESGSMPYAQMHYPFENKEKFEKNFPAEFIAEGVDQTRAWFYYLHILSNAVKETEAFKHVVVNGIVLAEDGKKMSKRLQNYPDPMAVMDKYGADAVRYYLNGSQVMKADNLNFSEKDMKEQARFFNTLFNVLSFYKMFSKHTNIDANKCEYHANGLNNILDKWMAAKLNLLIKNVTQKMNNYDLHAVREIPAFIDDLSTWYLRRSRERFKGDDEADKNQAIFALGKALFELSKLMAPFMPFTAEYVYQELGKECGCLKESVHLEGWPVFYEDLIDEKILNEMDLTRQVVEMGLAKRAAAGIKVRQPLRQLTINNQQLTKEYRDLIKDEINVKQVMCHKGEGELNVELDIEITEELKEEGLLRELTRVINDLRKEAGLTIDNFIALEYNTDSDQLNRVFEKYKEELKKAVLAQKISKTEEDLEQVKINDLVVGLKIKKV